MAKSRKWVVGIDEAGRGPLAGPVTLGAVICRLDFARNFFMGIKDSKHLSPRAREEWLKKIKDNPEIFYRASSVGHATIDRLGISKAIKMGVGRVLQGSLGGPTAKWRSDRQCRILLDGSLKAPAKYTQKTIIKGDEKISIIAAASIVAKVSRDRKMKRFGRLFPEYAFEIHKGYGTRLHYERIKKHGLCDIHRRSYLTRPR